MRVAITGASGFLGGALAIAYRNDGDSVVALVRKSSQVHQLEKIGVEIQYGELTDEDSFHNLLKNADLAIHCAAFTGEFGPWDLFNTTNVLSAKNFFDAGLKQSCPRLIYISSVAVYGNGRHHRGTDEDSAFESLIIDNYTRSKIMAETLAFEYIDKHELPLTIIRPGYIWGLGDRAVMPRLVEGFKKRQIAVIEQGMNLMNLAHVDNVVDAVKLAATNDNAFGQAYNITDDSKITTKRFLEDLIAMIGIDYKLRSFPYVPVYSFAYACEIYSKLRHYQVEPLLTRYSVRMAKYDQIFNISKAVTQLDYRPRVSYKTGMMGQADYVRRLYYGKNYQAGSQSKFSADLQ
jgi:2-alkyl-3-oxoalkanoate reductase